MKKALVVISIFFVAVRIASADFDRLKWRYQKEVILCIEGQVLACPPATGPVFVEALFDTEVFSKANGNLSDIRIVNTRGEEVPYVLATEAPESRRETYPVRIVNKGSVPGSVTTFIADLGRAGLFHNQITIKTSSKNFRREVMIEGSHGQETWLKLESNKYIYDYTVEFKAQDTTVRYPEATFRYLRVTIFDRGETPLAVTGAEMSRSVLLDAKRIEYSGAFLSSVNKPEERAAVVTFDLGVRGLPTNSVTFTAVNQNFNREIALEGSDDGTNWEVVLFRDVLFSYQTPQFAGNKFTVTYPERNHRYYRLTVFNKDDRPLSVTGATFSGFLRKLIFQYDLDDRYAIYYGNQRARFPQYDLKNYLQYFDAGTRRLVGLGPEIVNAAFVPEKVPQKPFSERYPALLTVTLLIAVGVVGFLTFRIFKKT